MDNKALLKKIRKAYDHMVEEDRENRRESIQDMEFALVPGEQWDDYIKKQRGDRPVYEFNRVRINGKKIVNEIRQLRPSGKVIAQDGGNKKNAEIVEGIIRNIWNLSNGDGVVDHAAEFQVYGGRGAWRVNVDYADDDSFYQDIIIKKIENPYTLYIDDDMAIITEMIDKDEFEKRWPKAEKVNFGDDEFDTEEEWENEDEYRVAEVWFYDYEPKTIMQLQDGKIVDDTSDEGQIIMLSYPEMIKNTREVKAKVLKSCIVSGDAILDKPERRAGKYLPFIEVYGERFNIKGKEIWHGIIRWAKDSQRSYNMSRTSISESIAMAPQAKWWATSDQANGHTDKWAIAHKENLPFMLYNADPKSPGPPVRMGGADVPIALIQESELASKEIDDVTGIYADDRGADSASQSGRAIYARQQQGKVTTFNYPDNIGEGIRRTWEIIAAMIPDVFDTERELRVLSEDGKENYVKINSFVPGPAGPIKINDLSQGKYGISITSGGSFTSKRQEAAEIYGSMIEKNPMLMQLAGDLIFKSMDLPYSEDIGERFKSMLPPEVRQTMDEEQGPEALMQQAQQAMAMVQQKMQEVEIASQEIQKAADSAYKDKSEAEKAKMDVEMAMSKLKVEEAKFEAKVAKELSRLSERTSKAFLQETELEYLKGEIVSTIDKSASDDVKAKDYIDQVATSIYSEVGQIISGINDAIRLMERSRPKVVRVESVRENGKLTAIPIYENSENP